MKHLKKAAIIRNRWIIVVLLMLAYTFSFMDRYVVNLLIEDMKRDLGLSDTQVSLLLGISFALFYATLGIPLGRLADQKSRTRIIASGITVWSIMTALCGTAQNYAQLFLYRMGVGTGEATLSPSAYSLITDYFPKRLWATAISVYSLGIYLGCAIAYIVGGKLIELLSQSPEIILPVIGKIFNWQLIFFLFGLPGLIVALLLLLVKEPNRKKINSGNLKDFIYWIRTKGNLFLLLCIGSSIFNIAVYATATWLPAYLGRVHHLKTNEVGMLLGLSTLILPSIGIIIGGKLGDHFAKKEGLYGRMKILFLTTLIFIPANFFYPFTSTLTSTAIAMIPHGLLISITIGISIACVQETIPANFRSSGSSILLFSQNLIGMGLGPFAVGILNDRIFVSPQGIAQSLMVISVCSIGVSAMIYFKGIILCRQFNQL